MDGIQQLDDPDLAGARNVRRTAGAEVIAGDFNQTQPLGNVQLAAIVERRRLGGGGEEGAYGEVFADGAVGGKLHRALRVLVEHAVIVHGHLLVAEVEADIIIAVQAVNQSRNDMLAAVALHPLIAQVKINFAGQHFAHGNRRARQMLHLAAALDRARDFGIADIAAVAALPAALGEKRRAVEHDGKTVPGGGAGKHARVKVGCIGVFVVESLDHGGCPFGFWHSVLIVPYLLSGFNPHFPHECIKNYCRVDVLQNNSKKATSFFKIY